MTTTLPEHMLKTVKFSTKILDVIPITVFIQVITQ